jgi:hypothetical protein
MRVRSAGAVHFLRGDTLRFLEGRELPFSPFGKCFPNTARKNTCAFLKFSKSVGGIVMKGGRRNGAGRPAQHDKTTAYPSLRVFDLDNQVVLQSWKTDVALSCYWQGSSVTHSISVTRTTCHYGGYRYWFVCPCCQCRVGTIYMADTPGCRRCLKLRYPSQSESAVMRAWRRREKVDHKLARITTPGGYRRPKGMHRQTFAHLLGELIRAQREQTKSILVLLPSWCSDESP